MKKLYGVTTLVTFINYIESHYPNLFPEIRKTLLFICKFLLVQKGWDVYVSNGVMNFGATPNHAYGYSVDITMSKSAKEGVLARLPYYTDHIIMSDFEELVSIINKANFKSRPLFFIEEDHVHIQFIKEGRYDGQEKHQLVVCDRVYIDTRTINDGSVLSNSKYF